MRSIRQLDVTPHHTASFDPTPHCRPDKTAKQSTAHYTRHKFYMTVGATLLMCQHIQISTSLSLYSPCTLTQQCDAPLLLHALLVESQSRNPKEVLLKVIAAPNKTLCFTPLLALQFGSLRFSSLLSSAAVLHSSCDTRELSQSDPILSGQARLTLSLSATIACYHTHRLCPRFTPLLLVLSGLCCKINDMFFLFILCSAYSLLSTALYCTVLSRWSTCRVIRSYFSFPFY